MYAFPECNIFKPLPLCYEDCIAVRELFCYKEWAHVEDKKSNGIHFTSRKHFRLPVCETLPKHNTENKTASCTYAGLVELKQDEITCKLFLNQFYFIYKIIFQMIV